MRSGSLADVTRWLLALACSFKNAVTSAWLPAEVTVGSRRHPFLALDECDQWEILGALNDHTVSGWSER